MDTGVTAAIGTLLISAPNLIVAFWVIMRQDTRIDKLLESQKWLIEQLMAMHPPQDDSKKETVLPPS